jgi:DNA primase
MISWRVVLSDLNVDWSDRGANHSAGSINIKCCWCGAADPSRHLSINEQTGQYYCFRRPRDHYGKSAAYLLRALGASNASIDALLQSNGSGRTARAERPKTYKTISVDWGAYAPAADNPRMLHYLADRGFLDCKSVAQRFDLRAAPFGKWANRLLIPFKDKGRVEGFTGRAIYPHMDPKYKTEAPGDLIYVPHIPEHPQALVLVEGPLDALKLAVACPYLLAVSILGLAMHAAKLERIYALAAKTQTILFVLDNDQPRSVVYPMLDELSAAIRKKVDRCAVPGSAKDPGELEIEDIRQWMHSALNGTAYSKTGRAILSA